MTKDKEIKLGDVVTMLKGQFAGETGVIVGILAASRYDIDDPYYEVDMNCEVPDKYKCHKTLLSPNNIIGGVSANEFKVMFKEPKPFIVVRPLTKERAQKEMEEISSEITNNPDKAKQIQKEWEESMSAKNKPTAEPSLADEIDAARLESLRLLESAKNTYIATLDNAYWQHYRAELVKELVLEMKTLNSDCADLITDFATRIVENLKKQSND